LSEHGLNPQVQFEDRTSYSQSGCQKWPVASR
jgi:hypothetical protein